MPIILHVEDEKFVRILYKEVFEEHGFQLIGVASGEEALKTLRNTSPDLIILDIKMPGMGGKAFLKKFHRLGLKIPVVISSAYPYSDLADDVEAYVVKSGDISDLVDIVKKLLTSCPAD
ncbi:response regulator [Thermodesulfobacteriota bacterium]